MATVETDTVTLSINDREVTVPKGMSLVEAAAEAGIEVPVFCYEPRLGAAVGACRMCLVEIEGMPKLQTACTTPVADGMIVHSHSDRAREGQDAVLEFLLINHPLDCPVCDKGGECPLQDLTFRYGPGNTRMTLPKRTHTKPVPISPLIKLDRERCILCYRCTRFSEDVSGDLQLVTENRGANSIITTFEGRPYDGEFSGNVTELCPVGALTSTSYRFRGRPWEIQNIPTVCGECPIGCNTYATIREGQVARVLSRNNPAVDDGWLCDRGRYTFPSLESEQRITTPLIRGGRGLEPVDGTTALDHVADRLRAAVERFGPGSVAIIASGDQTSEEAHLWARIQEQALGGGPIVCGPEGGAGWGELAAHSATIADLDDADLIVVAGATDLVHRAPILELRIRRAVERGARVVTIGAGATRLDTLRAAEHISAAPGTAHAALLAASQGVALKGLSDRSVILWNGRMSAPVATVLAHIAHTSGCRVLPTPLAANELGCQAAGLGTHTPAEALEAVEQGTRQGRGAARRRPGRRLARRRTLARVDGARLLRAAGEPVPDRLQRLGDDDRAVADAAREGGHVHQHRGPRAAPAGSRAAAAGRASTGSCWRQSWAGGWASTCPTSRPPCSPTWPPRARRSPASPGPGSARAASAPSRPPAPAAAPAAPHVAEGEPEGTIVVGYRQLMSGPTVEGAPALHFQRRNGIEISHDDAQQIGVATGDRVEVSFAGASLTGAALVQRRLRPGVVRLATAVPYVGPGELRAAPEEAADA